MSIDVTIRQKLFGGKTVPLEVILGDELCCGDIEGEQISVGSVGKYGFIAFNPRHIARGFCVAWTAEEKNRIALRLPTPSTKQELSDFFAAVERIAVYWDGKVKVDGRSAALTDFLAEFDSMAEFNDEVIRDFARQVIDDGEPITFPCVYGELDMGKEEAALFSEDTFEFARWLHERQSGIVTE